MTSQIRRDLDWLGSARRINTDINDEMQTLKFEVEVLRWANKELRSELTAAKPLIAYALKRKASLAAYELKRGRSDGA